MAFESPLDFTKPMGFPADMSDHIDPSDLMSSYQPSDIDWLSKDPFEILPWDLSGLDQTFNPFTEGNGLYSTSNHGSPAGYRAGGGYTVKTEDVMSDTSPFSDAESETWSPIYGNDNIKSGSQSPVDAIGRKHESKLPFSSEPENPTKEHANNVRKESSASSSSSTSSSSPLASPKLTTTTTTSSSSSSTRTNNKSARSLPPSDPDAAAVMKRKKAAHNAIEKRYRTNMNAKFLALGNAIPRSGGPFNSAQSASSKGPRKHSLCHARETMSSVAAGRRPQHEQLQQQQNQQQNKSEILTNALAYINQLQDENSRLKSELLVLKENLLPGGNIMWRR
ncbi:hypothetical protein UA08_00685 [Talaromyces atroroseus]|uniref:BHLH domain-containing protein n=1 Tax=Talaromyces atroroseus TaxID=1441469 RepID=A0A225BEA0_TALAT|nr:hypothetical protein UA08_00685 [Talaromyces atroroseus]OKL64347.1 hypothetical protein UA08_00685 [Talaromyces atroroseus]